MRDVPDGSTPDARPARSASAPPARPDAFTIHVGARLGPEWGEWLAASEILARDDGSGLITAAVRDQAMLYGLLERVRDLGVPLLGLYAGCALRAPPPRPRVVASYPSRPTPHPDQGAIS